LTLRLVPLRQKVAKQYIADHHRHSGVPVGDVIRVGVADEDGQLRGVGMAGRPVARALDDGRTLEVIRIATDGSPNACSMLYGALVRAAKALGYERVYTYTLQSETGASLKASGWTHDADLDARETWSTPSRPRDTVKRPTEAKRRWVQVLRP
jgi:hypothetical protein